MRQNRGGEHKLLRLFGLFSVTLFLIGSSLFASFEDFKRQQDSSFQHYKDVNDEAFSNYLKAQWEEYTAKQSAPFYEKSKPKNILPKQAQEIKSVGPRVLIHLDTPTKISEDIAPKEFDENISKADVTFDFFGANLGFTVAPTIKDAKFYPYSQVGIANFFDVMASSDYEPLVTQLQAVKNTLILNDWGICLLVDKLAREVYSSDDEAKLFTWFLLNKIGYNVKIGISSKHIVLMHYSEKIIYATPSYSFDTKKFYLLPLHSSYNKGMRVYSYKQDYPGATKALDLTLKTLPSFPEAFAEKNLRFKQFGKEYVIAFNYNENLMSFMATYPQADYETFFNAPMQESTYEQIAKEIKAHIDGKRASVAMNFVLNFVQNAFVYERDDEQFGREKVMFAQETLIYDKSDCEDRAILFAYLMKRLFHIGVIGVKYSDHMATALYIPLDGDSVKVGTKKFVVADPTYINANIGQSMPQYKSKIPQSFIVVKRDGV